MANELLRKALDHAGLEIDELAQIVQVDPKTAQRWLTGRIPYRRHRTRVARALGVEESELWPDLEVEPAPPNPEPALAADAGASLDSGDETLVETDAGYGALDRGGPVDWRALLAAASERIDLLDFSLAAILASPDVVEDLARKAEEGVQIRVLISSPFSPALYQVECEHDLDKGWWADPEDSREPEPIVRDAIIHSTQILDQVYDLPNVSVRRFVAHRYNSILRFDEQMLVLIHTWGVPTTDALQLHTWASADDGGVFERFIAHFDAVWEHAMDLDQPYDEDDLEDWELQLEASGRLSDNAYKLRLYQLRAAHNHELNEINLHYQEDIGILQRQWELQNENPQPPTGD